MRATPPAAPQSRRPSSGARRGRSGPRRGKDQGSTLVPRSRGGAGKWGFVRSLLPPGGDGVVRGAVLVARGGGVGGGCGGVGGGGG